MREAEAVSELHYVSDDASKSQWLLPTWCTVGSH